MVIIGLADTHFLKQEGYQITSVQFCGIEDVAPTSASYEPQLLLKPRGKKRSGTKIVEAKTTLCIISATLPATNAKIQVKVPACLKAKVLELNDMLLYKPQLLVEQNMSQGFIAILDPTFGNSHQQPNQPRKKDY